MEIIFIGTGCGVPSKRASPSILVRISNDNLLFDTGPGSLRKLFESGLTYNEVDYIVYTHFHIDHIADLAPFLFASKYPRSPRKKELNIIGPKGLKNFYNNLTNLYGEQIQNLSYNVRILETSEFQTSEWKIESKNLPHTAESVGYRVTNKEGKVLVYSGDTEYSPELLKLAQSADILVLECSFPIKTAGHLYPEAAAKTAKEAKAKHLVLTHLYPVCDNYPIISMVKKIFDGKVTIAEDLMHIEL
jgi:ribonuclease BN (tRNA processing enzyme)